MKADCFHFFLILPSHFFGNRFCISMYHTLSTVRPYSRKSKKLPLLSTKIFALTVCTNWFLILELLRVWEIMSDIISQSDLSFLRHKDLAFFPCLVYRPKNIDFERYGQTSVVSMWLRIVISLRRIYWVGSSCLLKVYKFINLDVGKQLYPSSQFVQYLDTTNIGRQNSVPVSCTYIQVVFC